MPPSAQVRLLESSDVSLVLAGGSALGAGEEVWFDNGHDRITAEHLLARTALAPLFPPVEIDGRLLCDAGLASNDAIQKAAPPKAKFL